MAYPNTISPVEPRGCTVTAYKRPDGTGGSKESDPADCNQLEGSRIFEIKNAIPFEYDGKITINIEFINPIDNWGEIGFKIKTYEVLNQDTDDETTYLVDMLESNALIPNLKCTAPCKECYEENGIVLDMEYCTECW